MNAPAPSEVAIRTDQDHEDVRTLSADSVPEGASFNEPRQSPNAVRPHLGDDSTFASFFDGAGI
jgi:hypothetical protein